MDYYSKTPSLLPDGHRKQQLFFQNNEEEPQWQLDKIQRFHGINSVEYMIAVPQREAWAMFC